MSKEFKPYNNEVKHHEFSAWEYEGIKGEKEVVISPQEAFLNECAQLRQDAVAKGYADGMQQAQTELAQSKAELRAWLELLQNPIQLLDEQLTQEIIQTIMWISQECIGVELSVHPDKLRALLNEIKNELPSLNSKKMLTMNPDDVEWLKREIGAQEIPGLHDILIPDPSLNRGDFYLKGSHSDLDGTIQMRCRSIFAKYIDKNSLSAFQPQD